MQRPKPAHRPAFIWQGLLIVLPLVLLAAFGLYSLRQDRLLALSEAKERCSRIAQEIAKTDFEGLILTTEKSPTAMLPIVLDVQGNLYSINGSTNRSKVVSGPIIHPLPLGLLSTDQLQLWNDAQRSEYASGQPTQAFDSYQKFIASKPPQPFVSEAKYSQALLILKGKINSTNAAVLFDLVKSLDAENAPRSENDLSFASLLQQRLTETASLHDLPSINGLQNYLDFLYDDPTEYPSFLTPLLLKFEKNKRWQQNWMRDNLARSFSREIAGLLPSPLRPHTFWIKWNDEDWFVSVLPDGVWSPMPGATNKLISRASAGVEAKNITPTLTVSNDRPVADSPNGLYLLQAKQENFLRTVMQNIAAVAKLPDYAEWNVQLAGHFFPAKSTKPLLATAPVQLRMLPLSTENFSVGLYLARPELLYAHQRQRTLLFGGLILISTLAAGAGLFRAYRSFQQQLRLNEMKSNFVSSVSHELRAPVASMRLMAEALDRGKISDAPKQKEYFRFIVQECRRLSSLVENILDFSRIEQGRKEYQFEPTDLTALVEQTVKLMEPCATERQVVLVRSPAFRLSGSSPALDEQPKGWTPNGDGLLLSCDGLALQQALINLIDNAIKHSPSGASVSVGLENDEKNVRLWVEDTGAGIPPEEHEKIFERFYRRGSELRRETQGIGIGLAIVKHIVEAHGGYVQVKSAVGQGSRFTIELPIGNNHEK